MITSLNPSSGKIEKMSKSRGNTFRRRADCPLRRGHVRLYTLFIGPPEKESEWSEDGVTGAFRFLNRVHDLCGAFGSCRPAAIRGRGTRLSPG
jgi:leucyl-tRNA synthetase